MHKDTHVLGNARPIDGLSHVTQGGFVPVVYGERGRMGQATDRTTNFGRDPLKSLLVDNRSVLDCQFVEFDKLLSFCRSGKLPERS